MKEWKKESENKWDSWRTSVRMYSTAQLESFRDTNKLILFNTFNIFSIG